MLTLFFIQSPSPLSPIFSPISLLLLFNVIMFVFAAMKLFQMQSRVRDGKRRSGLTTQASSEAKRKSLGGAAQPPPASSEDDVDADEEERTRMKRRFIRQISTVSQKFSQKKRANYAALKEK